MGRFYGTKIKHRDINPKTGEAWKIEDVPKYWYTATSEWLDKNE